MVGDRYLQHILKWGAWFLMDPELFTRSLLGAGEIAVVDVLDRTIAHYAVMPEANRDPRLVRWLDDIRRIADWNREPTEPPPPSTTPPSFGGVIERGGGPSSEDFGGSSGVSLEEMPPDETSLFISGEMPAPPSSLTAIDAATASPMPR